MERGRFRRLVLRALQSIPSEFAPYLENIAIVIEREPSRDDLRAGRVADGQDLFGLYVGVPITERAGGTPALPARIVIYQGPLERHCTPAQIPRQVRNTVVHEVGHHFGIDECRLRQLGVG
ncbi:MAG: metallopeptidase family protein [Dehalococcoidia bacterium]|nr:metallopeptidase family protein [Dehalococcoidia bacterium]